MSQEEEIKKNPPLDSTQIQMAEMMIEELHPIADTPIEVSFPVLFWPWGVVKRCIYGDVTEKEVQADEMKIGLMEKFGCKNLSLTPEARKIMKLQQTKKERDL